MTDASNEDGDKGQRI